mmetsp:Transcript_34401/g.60294  ORF Transcript_34401/g.60294 Transcript_34401/m.60294 type:complete len:182 (-) Transcript_34401:2430-2975(-)
MTVVYEDIRPVTLTHPYVPGFLAFREVPHLIGLFSDSMEFKPQLVLVDGNGVYHTRGFGLASHLGVLLDIPTVGVSKTIFAVDGLNKKVVRELSSRLTAPGESIDLVGKSRRVWGAALKATEDTIQPLIVSVGHRISLPTALEVVKRCCLFKIPEPIRQADKRSRAMVKRMSMPKTDATSS